MAFFDNLEDVQSKFVGTICYHEGKPVYVKSASSNFDMGKKEEEFFLVVQTLNGRGKTIKLTDKTFSYRNYNLGYVNYGSYAPWWYRRPLRQYRQGLRADQMSWLSPHPELVSHDNFRLAKPYADTLLDNFPTREQCKATIKDGLMRTIAFHRDFALSWDHLHGDYILEYRGSQIGVSQSNKLDNFKLLDEFKHLNEVLAEVV